MPGLRSLSRTTSSSPSILPQSKKHSTIDASLPLSSSSQSNQAGRGATSPATNTKLLSSPTSAMDVFKRHSLAALGKTKEKEKDKDKDKEKDKENSKTRKSSAGEIVLTPASSTSAGGAVATNSLNISVESPPAIFYGPPNQSTGALFSAQLRLTIIEAEVTVKAFTMKLISHMTNVKPVNKDCSACITQTSVIKDWNFLTQPKAFESGVHSMPFSIVIPGHLPTTTMGELGRLQYFFLAEAVLQSASGTSMSTAAAAVPATSPSAANPTTTERTITMRRELDMIRAVKPLEERVSMRIFPPTNLVARISHFPIIHPIGESTVKMQVSGIRRVDGKMVFTWRLRKLNWRLEEKECVVSPACSRHTAKLGGENKGISHETIRVVGRDEHRSGWKTDTSEGMIDFEFVIRPFVQPRPLCDVESPSGFVVSHMLIIEVIVVEDWSRQPRPENVGTTGAARILRMQHPVMITERGGMNISWDEERPPLYEDVPASPPMYPADRGPPAYAAAVMEPETIAMQRVRSEIFDYHGTPLDPATPIEEEEEFEGLTLGPSASSQFRRQHINEGPSSSSSHSGNAAAATAAMNRSGNSRSPMNRPASSGAGRGKMRLTLLDFETEEDHPQD